MITRTCDVLDGRGLELPHHLDFLLEVVGLVRGVEFVQHVGDDADLHV